MDNPEAVLFAGFIGEDSDIRILAASAVSHRPCTAADVPAFLQAAFSAA
jgi:hypothetical protein